MTKYIRNRFMGLWNIFKDDNDFNEKNIVGFISFAIMCIFAITDVIFAIRGIRFEVNDYIYNSFVIVTLGSFGISEIGKSVGIMSRNKYQPPNKRDEGGFEGGFGGGEFSGGGAGGSYKRKTKDSIPEEEESEYEQRMKERQ